MKRRFFLQALTACAFAAIFLLSGCSTVQSRIAENPEAFGRLSPTDQALAQQGKIREGMSKDGVFIAWGAPSQRVPGRNRGETVETWIYYATTAGDYYGPFYYGYPYGHGLGYGYYGGYRHRFRRHFFYDPFYDPFFYRHANIVHYPERTVSFSKGRAISYQFLPTPRFL